MARQRRCQLLLRMAFPPGRIEARGAPRARRAFRDPCCRRGGRPAQAFRESRYHVARGPSIRPASADTMPTPEPGPPPNFIRTAIQEDIAGGALGRARRHALPARAQRLPPHRARQGDLDRLRPRPGVRRDLPPPVRRHQPGEGGGRVRRGDPGGHALARLRLGAAPLLRLRLLRAALPVGGGADPPRPRLRRRPLGRGDPAVPRHPDRAGPEQPLPGPVGRGEPRPLPADAGGGVPGRRARPPGEDRHGVAEHEPARPDALPDPPRGPPPDGRPLVHLPDVRLRAPAVGLDRAGHALALHASSTRTTGRSTTGCARRSGSTTRSRSSSRGSTSPTR